MKKLPADWFSTGLSNAKKEVQAWPEWKQVAMQVSSAPPRTTAVESLKVPLAPGKAGSLSPRKIKTTGN